MSPENGLKGHARRLSRAASGVLGRVCCRPQRQRLKGLSHLLAPVTVLNGGVHAKAHTHYECLARTPAGH